MNAIFITGTDTHIGKTFVSALLLKEYNALGLKTFAIKPIASGSQQNADDEWQNEDALCLQTHASIKKSYPIINPVALRDPIAPHLAARNMNLSLSKNSVKKTILSSIQSNADINIIEGAGGWDVPINDAELFSDVICELNIPVILVVGIKLGCINHALLTYKNIIARNAPFIGWIANCVTPDMPYMNENITTLQQWLKHPCLGIIPYQCKILGHIKTDIISRFLSQ